MNMDTIRIDRLADPKFAFGYKICADGKVNLLEPRNALCSSLRGAIDYARCVIKEQPFCIKCARPLNESNQVGEKYACPNCETVFKP